MNDLLVCGIFNFAGNLIKRRYRHASKLSDDARESFKKAESELKGEGLYFL